MQAASVNVQPAPQAPQPDRFREANPADAGILSTGGLSFRAILSRNLRESPSPKEFSLRKSKPAGEPRRGAGNNASNGKFPASLEAGRSAGIGKPREPGTGTLRGDSKDVHPQNPGTPGSTPAQDGEDAAALPGSMELSQRKLKTGTSPEADERPDNRQKARELRPAASPRAEESVALVNAPGVARTPSSESRGRDTEDKAPESSSVDRRRNDRRDTKVTVQDLRMRPGAAESEAGRESNRPVETSSPGGETAPAGGRPAEAPVPSERAAAAKPQGGMSFSDTLARHIADAGAQDIVKAAHIVLRDGDAGLIRLRLEPESLGNVKIELKMTEKNITGRIVVETDEARNAFEKSLSSLRDAFTAGGFETASLEVSVGGGEARGREEPSGPGDGPFFSERLRDLDRAVPAAVESAFRADGGVNIWA